MEYIAGVFSRKKPKTRDGSSVDDDSSIMSTIVGACGARSTRNGVSTGDSGTGGRRLGFGHWSFHTRSDTTTRKGRSGIEGKRGGGVGISSPGQFSTKIVKGYWDDGARGIDIACSGGSSDAIVVVACFSHRQIICKGCASGSERQLAFKGGEVGVNMVNNLGGVGFYKEGRMLQRESEG